MKRPPDRTSPARTSDTERPARLATAARWVIVALLVVGADVAFVLAVVRFL